MAPERDQPNRAGNGASTTSANRDCLKDTAMPELLAKTLASSEQGITFFYFGLTVS